MAQNVLLRAAGLYSYPNRLSTIPSGALLKAKNIFINRDNIAESRRGFKIYGNAMGDTTLNTAHQLLSYKGRILRHYGPNSGTTLDFDDGSGNFNSFSLIITGDIASGNSIVSNISSTGELEIGMTVIGTGIPANTKILNIINNSSITLTHNASATTTGVSLTFTWFISEVSQGTRIKSVEQNGNFYFTTSDGIKKISATSASQLPSTIITNAGGIKALDFELMINDNPGFLLPSSVVGYRVVWGIKDANQNLILGAPSSRSVIQNTNASNSKTVNLKITIPKNITTAYFYQIYRTAVLSNANSFTITGDITSTSTSIVNIPSTGSIVVGMVVSGTGIPSGTVVTSIPSSTTISISNAATSTSTGVNFTFSQILNQDPGDEEQLVYETNPTLTDLNNGYIAVTDVTPETFRQGGAYLYTNQNSGEGILQANDIPPLALDITAFKGYTFYSNIQTKQQINLSLLSVSALVSGTSTLTISDGTTTNTYTFTSSTIASDTTFNSNTLTNIADTSILRVGASLSGPGIADGSFIVSIVDANTITISQVATATATASSIIFATEDSLTKKIAISQFATPSQQVDETARSLIRIINSQGSEVVYAYYTSGPTDVPGQMSFEARVLNQNAFYFNVDNDTTGGQFSPQVPTSGQTVVSTNDVLPNRLFYSKFQQPEAVPSTNFYDIGPQDKAILRILALRDSLFIFKEDGVYRLSGASSASFTIYPFDFSTILKAPDSAVVLNNLIYIYSTQGIGKVSDTGIEVISRPIEDYLNKLLIPSYTHFKTATFGVSYETDRAYYLFTVSNTADTYATQCLRYNTFTNSWTLLDLSKRSGIVNPGDDNLYLGAIDTNFIEQERKAFDRTDFADREYITSIGSNSVTETKIVLSSISNIKVGDVLTQIQYLTINKYNQLLSKLDRDSILTSKNYVLSLTAVPGDNLSTKIDNLIDAIANDPGRTSKAGSTPSSSYTSLKPTGNTFPNQQTNFNNVIALLNLDLGLGYKNYSSSTGTTAFEFVVQSTDSSTNSIQAPYTYPLIQGNVTTYAHIECELQWVPQYLQDVSITKHVSEGTLIFEDSSFTTATLSYATDLSANFEDQPINGFGNGIFGNLPYGEGLYGGNGSGVPFRTYLPKDKQRCRYVNVLFKHSIAREIFSLYGLSLSYNPISQRGWR